MAAPIKDRFDTPPKWINPCGTGEGPVYYDLGTEYYHEGTWSELVERISVTARIALTQAESFKEEYVRKTFNQELSNFHELWIATKYDWLPSSQQIPKRLGETLSEDYLKSLPGDAALAYIYNYLQRFAVGLEQIVYDQGEYGEFKSSFMDAEFALRATLCEVRIGMEEWHAQAKPDVTRDVMPVADRDVSDVSLRHLRDWIIYRDYMNGLEYVIQLMEHFRAHP